MIRQMLKESGGTTFDKMRSINQNLAFEYATQTFQLQQVEFKDQQKRNLGLIDEDGYYTNAALLLSDQCRHIIRCAVYEGTGKGNSKHGRSFQARFLNKLTILMNSSC